MTRQEVLWRFRGGFVKKGENFGKGEKNGVKSDDDGVLFWGGLGGGRAGCEGFFVDFVRCVCVCILERLRARRWSCRRSLLFTRVM
jgi:hypothetical protein